MKDPATTRLSLLRAAERLFSERGIDSVSMREVASEAGQRNVSATQYHFGSRDGVLEAILQRHAAPIHEKYAAMVDLLEARGDVSLASLVEALVRPLVSKLDDPDGGRAYLAIAAQLALAPGTSPAVQRASAQPGVDRLHARLLELVDAPLALKQARLERLDVLLFSSLVARAHAEAAQAPTVGRELFVRDLVDCLCALVSAAPTSQALRVAGQARAE